MFQIFNWVCLLSICFLVLEIMVYFCKDAINLFNGSEGKNVKSVTKTRVSSAHYEYQDKIAK